jgi:hypothetical protein
MSYVVDEDTHLQDSGTKYGMTAVNGFTYVMYHKRAAAAPNSWICPCAIYDDTPSGSDNIAVYYDNSANRQLRCQWSASAADQRRAYWDNSGSGVADDTWYQTIVRSSDGANVEFWINGTKATDYKDLAGTPPGNLDYPNMSIFNIGSWYPTLGNAFDGKIAEVGIWDRVLTAGEITNLIDDSNYKIDDVTSDGSLIRYWPLYDDYTDHSGNGKTLTALNGTPSADTADHPVDPPISIQPAMVYFMNMMRG